LERGVGDVVKEEFLDRALAQALADNPVFARWFFSRTKFSGLEARCVEVRSDNPWSRVKLSVPGGPDGVLMELIRDAETDVLAVFVTPDGRRIALHVENKLAGGSFTPHQPQSYRERLEQWKGRVKLGMYDEATSVLVAPHTFREANAAGAELFEAFVSHEELAEHLPAFASAA
jgi:hypothetical protein